MKDRTIVDFLTRLNHCIQRNDLSLIREEYPEDLVSEAQKIVNHYRSIEFDNKNLKKEIRMHLLQQFYMNFFLIICEIQLS